MSFVARLFSEDDGKPSFSRIISAVTIGFALGWITFIVSINGSIPDLAGLSLFVGAVTAATYGVNKAADAVAGIRSSKI